VEKLEKPALDLSTVAECEMSALRSENQYLKVEIESQRSQCRRLQSEVNLVKWNAEREVLLQKCRYDEAIERDQYRLHEIQSVEQERDTLLGKLRSREEEFQTLRSDMLTALQLERDRWSTISDEQREQITHLQHRLEDLLYSIKDMEVLKTACENDRQSLRQMEQAMTEERELMRRQRAKEKQEVDNCIRSYNDRERSRTIKRRNSGDIFKVCSPKSMESAVHMMENHHQTMLLTRYYFRWHGFATRKSTLRTVHELQEGIAYWNSPDDE